MTCKIKLLVHLVLLPALALVSSSSAYHTGRHDYLNDISDDEGFDIGLVVHDEDELNDGTDRGRHLGRVGEEEEEPNDLGDNKGTGSYDWKKYYVGRGFEISGGGEGLADGGYETHRSSVDWESVAESDDMDDKTIGEYEPSENGHLEEAASGKNVGDSDNEEIDGYTDDEDSESGSSSGETEIDDGKGEDVAGYNPGVDGETGTGHN